MLLIKNIFFSIYIYFEIYGRNFYDQEIDDSIKQYDEIRKVSVGQVDDYTKDCLKKYYRLIIADFSKQKALDADPRAIQQIIRINSSKHKSNNLLRS